MIKTTIKKIADGFGYRISRIPAEAESETDSVHTWGTDPFSDMVQLVSGIRKPVIFDVGAYHGLVSLDFRRLIPNSKVYAFEPFPESFEQLSANVAEDDQITGLPFGFAESAGQRQFSSNTFAPSNSLLETDSRGHETWGVCVLETKERIDVEFRTIDDVVAEFGLPSIDILKLDCQGAEPLVVEGAQETLGNKKARVIYTEMITQPTYIGQQTIQDGIRMFEDLGYSLFNLYHLQTTPTGFLRQVDAIFVDEAQLD